VAALALAVLIVPRRNLSCLFAIRRRRQGAAQVLASACVQAAISAAAAQPVSRTLSRSTGTLRIST